MADLDAIFKAYDIRGTFPDQIDADGCYAIGAAFARFALDEVPCPRFSWPETCDPPG